MKRPAPADLSPGDRVAVARLAAGTSSSMASQYLGWHGSFVKPLGQTTCAVVLEGREAPVVARYDELERIDESNPPITAGRMRQILLGAPGDTPMRAGGRINEGDDLRDVLAHGGALHVYCV